MDNLTLGSVACVVSPASSTARFLDDASLICSTGNGLVISDIETGSQVCVCLCVIERETKTSSSVTHAETNLLKQHAIRTQHYVRKQRCIHI